MKNDCRIFLITYIMRTVRAGISEDSRGWGEGVGGRERERERKRGYEQLISYYASKTV